MSTSDTTSDTPASPSSQDVARQLPIRCVSKVVRGYGRGSSDLGIPTANLSREGGSFSVGSFDDLPTGIYWGFAKVGSTVLTSAISLGYNPTYGNKEKTVEAHLIANKDDKRRSASSCGETVLKDCYDQTMKLSIVGYLRPELPFEGIEKLVEAIKGDITKSEELGSTPDAAALAERAWVETKGISLA
mmetsp:Transcript_28037/g.39491  ORF Transcript_28037/g.39491 Transcript_28037/m.39491 type:complete len:188 (+) Transcript_28037:90-653(+)